MDLVKKYKQLKFERFLKNKKSDLLEFESRYTPLPNSIYSYMSNKDKFWELRSAGINKRSLISIDELKSHLKTGRFLIAHDTVPLISYISEYIDELDYDLVVVVLGRMMSKLLYNIDVMKYINICSSNLALDSPPCKEFFTDFITILNHLGSYQNTFIYRYKKQEFNLFDSLAETAVFYKTKMSDSDDHMIALRIKKFLEEGIRFGNIKQYEIFDSFLDDELRMLCWRKH